ncbi:MAG: methyltransferase [Deltaproteobacteria bacterium RBG_13_61_14]|nr:MAG: methyltransferase [Deltaproteobacteria bacterium RBG_13_61_14]
MEKLKELVKTGKAPETEARVKELLAQKVLPEKILQEALIPAMDEVGDLFQAGEYFVPEMLVAARAMQRGLAIIKPLVVAKGIKPIGKVVIGTVKGDLHDIGKNLVCMALEGAGFEVVDVGTDATPEKFVAAIKEHQPQVVGLSALLTTTMLSMKDVIQALKAAGVREQVKVMIGGAPIRQEYADEIGADYYGKDSTSARDIAREVIGGE